MNESGSASSRFGRVGRLLGIAGAALGLAAAQQAAVAQTSYPSRPVEIVVGFPAGTSPDIIARTLGDKLRGSLAQPVVVRNMPGASGSIAAAAVAKAAPDGHTLLLAGNASLVVNQHILDNLPYDPARDLTPVAQIAVTPNVLVVAPGVPARTVQDFVDLARTRPEKLTYGHVGIGTSQHLAAVFLENRAGIRLTPVPYKGGPAIYPDLLEGRLDACFCNIATTLPLVREGKLRALAVTSLQRSPSAPAIPTLAESGFGDVDTSAWFGIMVPSGTQAAIVERLRDEIAKAMTAEVRNSFQELGMIVVPARSSAEFGALIGSESAYWRKLVASSGIKLQ